MNPAQEIYIHKWITSLLRKVRQSGLSELSIDQAWERAKHPVIPGMMMVDPILHTFTRSDLVCIAEKYYAIHNEVITVPEEASTPNRQEIFKPQEPFTTRKTFAQRLSGVVLLKYFDPFMDSPWLSNFNEIFQLIGSNALKELHLLTSEAGIQSQTKREAFIELAKRFAVENGVRILIKTSKNKQHPRFFIANERIWKVGHSLNSPDKFEGIDEQIETKDFWKTFWDTEWDTALILS